jgi:hypothetical protein
MNSYLRRVIVTDIQVAFIEQVKIKEALILYCSTHTQKKSCSIHAPFFYQIEIIQNNYCDEDNNNYS